MTKEEKIKKILTLMPASTMSHKETVMWTIMLDEEVEEESVNRLLACLEKEVNAINNLYLTQRTK